MTDLYDSDFHLYEENLLVLKRTIHINQMAKEIEKDTQHKREKK